MDPLHAAHLIVLSLWGGLVAGEAVLELAATDPISQRHAAQVHYWMDLLVEAPLLAGVLATGGWLAARAWPPGTLLTLKMAAGLVAVMINAYCVVAVIRRKRQMDDAAALQRWSRRVRLSATGVPFAAVATVIGLAYFRR